MCECVSLCFVKVNKYVSVHPSYTLIIQARCPEKMQIVFIPKIC